MNIASIDCDVPQYDDLMEELYAIRRQISAEYGHDVRKICEAGRKREAEAKALGMTYAEYCLQQLRLRRAAECQMVGEDGPSEKYK